MTGERCVFCAIVRGTEPATIVRRWRYAMAFVPLDPVVEGHVLVVPTEHYTDIGDNPVASGLTMSAAAEYVREIDQPCNVITSKGREATQSVFHLHLHVVPRVEGDGLALPWYSGKRSKAKR